MSRSTLEKITASLVVLLTTVLTFGFILIVADNIFDWDLFSPFMEKVLYFLASTLFSVILASTLINIMLNLSRLANFSEAIARKLMEDNAHEK